VCSSDLLVNRNVAVVLVPLAGAAVMTASDGMTRNSVSSQTPRFPYWSTARTAKRCSPRPRFS
jgi:hypothetical protein